MLYLVIALYVLGAFNTHLWAKEVTWGENTLACFLVALIWPVVPFYCLYAWHRDWRKECS